ncbi:MULTISPECIES: rubredoxin [unclassified Sinorhizobium]|uniref:rubredoxin n=1 Tax=unclassified Sinorhizobium TaxID=2613772 RepID=UPI0024C30359|nr:MULTISPECIES: rubredoxin [unclassified Sinorhizobium]MDK1376548.1 rubredoxin [Sinorhizobium sp. 6-70]MDK1481517.1 rubredoxin [Sinorhizobium sp. 6-117]
MSAFDNFGKCETVSGDRMERGICGHVYDPAADHRVSHIPSPFADLPEEWRYPNCDAPQRFKRLGDDG